MTIEMSELGDFYVFDDDDRPFAGPYDTPEEAQAAYPEAVVVIL